MGDSYLTEWNTDMDIDAPARVVPGSFMPGSQTSGWVDALKLASGFLGGGGSSKSGSSSNVDKGGYLNQAKKEARKDHSMKKVFDNFSIYEPSWEPQSSPQQFAQQYASGMSGGGGGSSYYNSSIVSNVTSEGANVADNETHSGGSASAGYQQSHSLLSGQTPGKPTTTDLGAGDNGLVIIQY